MVKYDTGINSIIPIHVVLSKALGAIENNISKEPYVASDITSKKSSIITILNPLGSLSLKFCPWLFIQVSSSKYVTLLNLVNRSGMTVTEKLIHNSPITPAASHIARVNMTPIKLLDSKSYLLLGAH